MQDRQAIVSFVLSADHRYVMPLGVTLTSLIENKRPENFYKIYILDCGLEESDFSKLKFLNGEGRSIEFIKIDPSNFSSFPINPRRHIDVATYGRLFVPELVADEKIIYLDCDLIVNSDLGDLFKTDLGNCVLAAVKEVSEEYVIKYYFRKIRHYFNSGVLLINTKKWKQENVSARSIAFLKTRKKMNFHDQDVLNHLLENQWLELDKTYNYQLDIHQAWEDSRNIKIFHFVGPVKPWHYLYSNRYQEYFTKYLLIGPWRDYRFEDNNFWTRIRKFIFTPAFIFLKTAIKKIAPARVVKFLKRIYWGYCNWRDNPL